MTNAQIALEAASRVYQGQPHVRPGSVKFMADELFRWLEEHS